MLGAAYETPVRFPATTASTQAADLRRGTWNSGSRPRPLQLYLPLFSPITKPTYRLRYLPFFLLFQTAPHVVHSLTCARIELSLRGIPANAVILLITFRSTSSLLYARIRLNKAPKLRPPGTCVDPRCLCRMHCEEEARRCYTPAFKQFQYIRGDTSGDDTCLNFNPLFPPGRAGRSLRFEPFCLDRFLASF